MYQKKPRKKPTLRFILDFYDAWLRGDNKSKVMAALEIKKPQSYDRFLAMSPELQLAKALADERRASYSSLSNYVYQHLSEEAQGVWRHIQFWEDRDTSSYDKIEQILAGRTKQLRQELFIHALINSSFDLSEACRVVSISKACLDNWRMDLAFRQLIEEIQWHKKNFFESALTSLVEQGHPGAIIFVNRTVNSDRGYSEKLEVKHSGQVDVGLNIEELDLDIDTRKKILEAIRRKKEKIIDVEPQPLKEIEEHV